MMCRTVKVCRAREDVRGMILIGDRAKVQSVLFLFRRERLDHQYHVRLTLCLVSAGVLHLCQRLRDM